MKTQEKNKPIRYKGRLKKNWNGVPATVRKSLSEISLYEAIIKSLLWHLKGGVLIWLIVFFVTFFGLAPVLFPKPKSKIQDIEFVMKNQHKRHYVKIKAKPSNADSDKASTHVAKNPASGGSKPANNSKNTNTKPKTNVGKKSEATADIPDISGPVSGLKSMSSGLGHSGKTSHRAAGFDSSSAAGFGSSSSDAGSTSSGGGFDKTTTRKIIAPYDISPYVNELKRNIRWNWKAPSGHEGKRVELFLRIAKDGKLIILNVKKTSEIGEVDNAALNAVRKSTPLNPLPSKYNKGYLDVVFTFDSNTVGSRY